MQTSGFLNSAELAEWREKFYVEEERVPRLAEKRESWNKRGSSKASTRAPKDRESTELKIVWLDTIQ